LNQAIEESKKTVERLNQVIEESNKSDIQIDERRERRMKIGGGMAQGKILVVDDDRKPLELLKMRLESAEIRGRCNL